MTKRRSGRTSELQREFSTKTEKRSGRLMLNVGEPVGGSIKVTVELNHRWGTPSKPLRLVKLAVGILGGFVLAAMAYQANARGDFAPIKHVFVLFAKAIKLFRG